MVSLTTDKVDTGNFYWSNRLIAAICDSHFQHHEADLDDYVETTMALGHKLHFVRDDHHA